jgi:hypothetical protein
VLLSSVTVLVTVGVKVIVVVITVVKGTEIGEDDDGEAEAALSRVELVGAVAEPGGGEVYPGCDEDRPCETGLFKVMVKVDVKTTGQTVVEMAMIEVTTSVESAGQLVTVLPQLMMVTSVVL